MTRCTPHGGDIGPERQVCNAQGTGWDPAASCSGSNLCAPTPRDPAGCMLPCVAAANSATDLGCDYWGVTLPNELDAAFLGNSSNGTLGTTASQAGFVVVNPGLVAATVQVSNAHISTVTVTVAPASSQTIQVPWLPICGTGLNDTALHLTSDQPITAYQFNPLSSAIQTSTSCTTSTDCDPFGATSQVCVNNRCATLAYTADASLLLPTPQLGTEYVALAYDHIDVSPSGTVTPLPAMMAVVATENDTHVHVAFAGATVSTSAGMTSTCGVASGNLPSHATDGGVDGTDFVLSAGQVLQFTSTRTGAAGTCAASTGNQGTVCRYPSDLTGSVVTSTADSAGNKHPIAVFSGAACTYVPYNQVACDHLEEALTPYRTWGKTFVGVKSHAYAGATQAVSDTWRLTSGCGPQACPNGNTVIITPQISGLRTKLITPCATANGATTCTLPPLQPGQTAPWLEFQLGSSFAVLAWQPVQLAQYFVSESATGTTATEGDPSLVLSPPAEQWRSSYRVLAPTTYLHNFLNLTALGDVSSCATCSQVQVDGVTVPASEWVNIPGTVSYAAVHALCTGSGCSASHEITAPAPVGVVVYGYDSYVSYGYPGGMNLATLQTTPLGQ